MWYYEENIIDGRCRVLGIINSVVLTAGVFAAIITSVVNIIIALMNNSKLNKIEQKKKMNEIDRYRYTHLYELLLSWQNYDSTSKGNNVKEKTSYCLLRMFLDDQRRYVIAKPLLEEKYTRELDIKSEQGNKLLSKLQVANDLNDIHLDGFDMINSQYFELSFEFSDLLKSTINLQLKDLLQKNN